MNYNLLYKNILLSNQKEFINSFKNGLYGKTLFFLGKKISYHAVEKNEDFIKNRKIIRDINNLQIRRYIQSWKIQFGKKDYLIHNLSVIKAIKKVKNQDNKQVYLSVACIVKNEGRYLKEWIEFHLAAGVEKFYIFDNESNDDTFKVLTPFIQKGIVIYIFFPGKKLQLYAYNIACDLCKNTSRWLALIDADEFLHPVKSNDLKNVLKDYENYPAVGVNWVVYGPCGHVASPAGLLTENYRYTFKDKNNELNCRIKSIVDPSMVLAVMSPHHCWYKNGKYAVDENKNEIVGEAIYVRNSSMSCTMFNHTSKLRINHYWTKSEEELRIKCNRGYPDGHSNPDFTRILERLNFPLVEDWESVRPFIKKV